MALRNEAMPRPNYHTDSCLGQGPTPSYLSPDPHPHPQVYDELSQKVFVDAKSDDGAFEKFLEKLKKVYISSCLLRLLK